MNDSFIQDLKSQVKLSSFLGKYIKVSQRGRRFVACCPFHTEKSPSFNIDDIKGFYHCFGCKESGDAITFLEKYGHNSFIDAVRELAEYAGIAIPERISIEKSPEFNILEVASILMEENLQRSALEYVKSRKISDPKYFNIGYCGDDKDFLVKKLIAKGYEESAIVECGLAMNAQNGIIDRFFGRVIFPIKSSSGRVLGFSGRVFKSGDVRAKYVNSGESENFKKREILYNYHNAKKTRSENIIVVEGFLDAISLHEYGFTNVVASMGTAITREHISLIFKRFNDIIFCLDGDNAGKAASVRAAYEVLQNIKPGQSTSFITLSEKDPDSFLQIHGAVGFSKALDARIQLHDFLWQNLKEHTDFKNPNDVSSLEIKIEEVLKNITDQNIFRNYKFFFKNAIFTAKYQKFVKPKFSKNIPITYQFVPQEAVFTAFYLLYHEEIKNCDELSDFNIELSSPVLQNLLNMAAIGDDLTANEDFISLNKNFMPPENLASDEIIKAYKYAYCNIIVSRINLEIAQNKHNFESIKALHDEKSKIIKSLHENDLDD